MYSTLVYLGMTGLIILAVRLHLLTWILNFNAR